MAGGGVFGRRPQSGKALATPSRGGGLLVANPAMSPAVPERLEWQMGLSPGLEVCVRRGFVHDRSAFGHIKTRFTCLEGVHEGKTWGYVCVVCYAW